MSNANTKRLYELGRPESHDASTWPDYLNDGFSESDLDDLIEIIKKEVPQRQLSQPTQNMWASLHAWRVLTQLVIKGLIDADIAIEPLLDKLETWSDDPWAQEEIPQVFKALGSEAIEPLGALVKNQNLNEYARILAAVCLYEIAQSQDDKRTDVADEVFNYMREPDLDAKILNGFVIDIFIRVEGDDLTDSIEEIRDLFRKKAVDLSVCGDQEDVEIFAGIRDERVTPKLDFSSYAKMQSQVLSGVENGDTIAAASGEAASLLDDAVSDNNIQSSDSSTVLEEPEPEVIEEQLVSPSDISDSVISEDVSSNEPIDPTQQSDLSADAQESVNDLDQDTTKGLQKEPVADLEIDDNVDASVLEADIETIALSTDLSEITQTAESDHPVPEMEPEIESQQELPEQKTESSVSTETEDTVDDVDEAADVNDINTDDAELGDFEEDEQAEELMTDNSVSEPDQNLQPLEENTTLNTTLNTTEVTIEPSIDEDENLSPAKEYEDAGNATSVEPEDPPIVEVENINAEATVEIETNNLLNEQELSFKEDDLAKLAELLDIATLEKPDGDDGFAVLDYWLMKFNDTDGLSNISELDGYFTAISCAPNNIPPNQWSSLIWGTEGEEPAWESEEDTEQFYHWLFSHYNQVIENQTQHNFEPLFLESEHNGELVTDVSSWCDGFMQGLGLWKILHGEKLILMEECIASIKGLTSKDDDSQNLLTESDVQGIHDEIESSVRRLYDSFRFDEEPKVDKETKKAIFSAWSKPAKKPVEEPKEKEEEEQVEAAAEPQQPIRLDTPKVGRNDPCPCGSGKKYKKCCLN